MASFLRTASRSILIPTATAAAPRSSSLPLPRPLLHSFARQPSAFAALQRRWLSDDARKKIEQAVKSDPVVVFMKGTPSLPQCGFSRAVCQILEVQGVEPSKMKTYNCLEDQELRQDIKDFSSWPTIPQVYINGEFVGGCDIMLSMHQSGELEKLLEKEGIVPPVSQEASSGPAST